MLGIDVIDPEFQDVVGKDPDEPWGKNLWLFNIRDDPNEVFFYKIINDVFANIFEETATL